MLQRLDHMERRLDTLEAPASVGAHPSPAGPGLELPSTQDIVLPPATPDQDRDAAPILSIHLAAEGLFLNGKRLSREAAQERLARVAREAPGTRLVVMSEPEVRHERVVEILDMARAQGLTDVAMSVRVHGETSPPEPPPPPTAAR